MEGESSKKRKQADICVQKRSGEYTVGWICAICTEYTAAQAALDEEHERPDYIAPGDQNDYTIGRIGEHNVVIAVLPDGEYGTDSAALVARDMLHSFTNIKIGLMVGIGGGAPSERHDIRLGDIVVSAPREGQSGVLQYDFGKMVQGEPFQLTRQLNQSPKFLRTTISGLESQYQLKGYGHLREIIGDVLGRNPKLQKEFGRPDLTSDRLYRSEIIHPTDRLSTPDCSDSCGDDPSKLVVRAKRILDEGAPVVHYGLIASANTLMKDAVLRDKLALEKNILCFEMEAAGLMNQFPCLVVRGIYDYSDSHKNKQWQGYAAIAAAAYAKDLLRRISSNSISPLQTMNREKEAQIAEQEKKKAFLNSLEFDQHKDRHDNIKAAHAETCKWLQGSVEYLDWINPDKLDDHHGFLWIKGKPGAGKSTIMKFALTTARQKMGNRIFISFFFNARGGSLEKSTLGMYQSLLLQLLQQLPTLYGKLDLSGFVEIHKNYRWHVEPLKSLFHQAIENIQASKVVCFIDALDECDEDEVRDMISYFKYLGDLAISKSISFLVCFSSRHYPYISISNGLSLVLENQKEHAQDIVKYVRSELKIGQSNIAIQILSDIPRRSRGVFMWVILVVLILNKEYDKGRVYNLETKYQELPGDLHELFREILTRNSGETPRETLRCLQWILFAERPLTPKELYFAVLSDFSSTMTHGEVSEHDIQRFILDSSLGFVDIIVSSEYTHEEVSEHNIQRFILDSSLEFVDIIASSEYTHKTVQFIHESVKDFLLKENGLKEVWIDSKSNIHGQSHEMLKQCCLRWIGMSSAVCSKDSSAQERTIFNQEEAKKKLPALDYAIQSVLYHANAAQKYGISQAEFIQEFEADAWIMVRSRFQDERKFSNPRLLYTLAEKNMSSLIRCYPNKLAFSELGHEYFRTPLFAALANGSDEAVLEFLKAQAENTAEFHHLYEEYCCRSLDLSRFRLSFDFLRSRNILSHLTHPDEGNKTLQVALLLNMRYPYHNLNWQEEGSQSPLLYVYNKGNTALLSILIEKCISDVKEIPSFSSALLRTAVEKRLGDFVEILLQKGAKIDARNSRGETALLCAVEGNHKDMAQLLINAGANIEACGWCDGKTPLTLAATKGYVDIASQLTRSKANIEARDSDGYTPLMLAAEKGHKDIVVLLLENECNIEATGKSGETPLFLAAYMNHTDVVIQLLEKGGNVEARDRDGMTPLMHAARKNLKSLIDLLLKKGANIEAMDKNGQTPLMWAIRRRNPSPVRLLLKRGAKVPTGKVANIRPWSSNFSQELRERLMVTSELTLLEFAQQFEDEEIIELLSRNGAT